jgi:ClpP class serine protease
MTEEAVREVATGMVFTGERALSLGLVDEVGGLRAAEEKARELAGVDADVPVEEYCERSLWDEIMSIRSGRGTGVDWLGGLGGDPLAKLARMLYLNTTLRDLVVR